jgi:hypothetical protein
MAAKLAEPDTVKVYNDSENNAEFFRQMMQTNDNIKSIFEAELDTPEPEQIKRTWLQKKWSYWKWKLFGFKPQKGPNGFLTHLCLKTD